MSATDRKQILFFRPVLSSFITTDHTKAEPKPEKKEKIIEIRTRRKNRTRDIKLVMNQGMISCRYA